VSSELLAMRRENLAQKSHSALLLEALLGKSSAELKAVHEVALTPAQKVMMLQRAPSTSSSTAAAATAPVTFASVLHKQTGRRLKAKQGEGVGGNAKQRNRARRIDGFIGDMTPLLERTVEYLLAQGADPNVVDADRNNALWIALQLKGSERVVKMLLEKGAEMVEALESEDESDDEAPAEEGKDSSSDRPAAQSSSAALQAYRPPQIASSVRAMRKTAGAHPSLPQTLRDLQNASDGAGDLFNFERGSTVDLAMKLGCERQALLLLKAGHLPHRNGRVRLLDFARLHGFSLFATEFLTRHLWEAVRDADEIKVLDMVRHMDRKLVDRTFTHISSTVHVAGFCCRSNLFFSFAVDPFLFVCCSDPDHTGRSPLYAAVESKDPSLTIVEALLKAGASPNHTDISATPMAVFPLCRAAAKVRKEEMRSFEEREKLCSQRSRLIARLFLCVLSCFLLQSTSVLALLIRHGLNPRLEVSDSGQTLLEFAHEAGARAESIALLQEAERGRSDKWQQQQQARAQQTETAAAARLQPIFNNHGR
jgi:ankyrin repeat protein